MSLADRLKQARLAAALTQEELAAKAGISQTIIYRLESGFSKRSRSLFEICTALNIELDWLITGKCKPSLTKLSENAYTGLPLLLDKNLLDYCATKCLTWSAETMIAIKNIGESDRLITYLVNKNITNQLDPARSFASGDIAIVYLEKKPKNHDLVIYEKEKEINIREYIEDGNEAYLTHLTHHLPPLSINDSAIKLIGIIIGKQSNKMF